MEIRPPPSVALCGSAPSSNRPEGIDQFTYTWDFGDGSNLVTGNRAILTKDSDRMVYGSHEPRLLKRRGVSLHCPKSG